jgi:hypothetical protein
MNGTKKTLTTLTAAAALAIGGIAIAQTTGSDTSQAGASLGSSSTMQNSGDQSLSQPAGNDTLSNSATSTTTDTSAMGASADAPLASAPQMDRN